MPAQPAETLHEALRPLRDAPERAAILLDVDGTLAPIVDRAEDAEVPEATALALAALAERYGLVACVSGRTAAEVRRLVGVEGIAYAGTHGAELLEPGAERAEVLPGLAEWAGEVGSFARARYDGRARTAGLRLEDKGPIAAFHWRGAGDEAGARALAEEVAAEAEGAGLATHWGRMVLEVRPPVRVDKGRAVRELVRRAESRAALFAGDDTTDLDGFAALDALQEEGTLEAAVRVGVRSEEGPVAIVERADLVVDGVAGFVAVLDLLAEG